LRYVRLDDGRDYGTEIVRAGLARVQTSHGKPVSEYSQLEQAQAEAVRAKRGVWGLCPAPAPGD
jgi:endonuclease YncB( thermonuclease family)